ncbi:MAG: hypothetical protein C0467_17520 [Planctomycetaceae bacterium]|nr:hypothetical protein [Planctomycetaceae bacterium]
MLVREPFLFPNVLPRVAANNTIKVIDCHQSAGTGCVPRLEVQSGNISVGLLMMPVKHIPMSDRTHEESLASLQRTVREPPGLG